MKEMFIPPKMWRKFPNWDGKVEGDSANHARGLLQNYR